MSLQLLQLNSEFKSNLYNITMCLCFLIRIERVHKYSVKIEVIVILILPQFCHNFDMTVFYLPLLHEIAAFSQPLWWQKKSMILDFF